MNIIGKNQFDVIGFALKVNSAPKVWVNQGLDSKPWRPIYS